MKKSALDSGSAFNLQRKRTSFRGAWNFASDGYSDGMQTPSRRMAIRAGSSLGSDLGICSRMNRCSVAILSGEISPWISIAICLPPVSSGMQTGVSGV